MKKVNIGKKKSPPQGWVGIPTRGWREFFSPSLPPVMHAFNSLKKTIVTRSFGCVDEVLAGVSRRLYLSKAREQKRAANNYIRF